MWVCGCLGVRDAFGGLHGCPKVLWKRECTLVLLQPCSDCLMRPPSLTQTHTNKDTHPHKHGKLSIYILMLPSSGACFNVLFYLQTCISNHNIYVWKWRRININRDYFWVHLLCCRSQSCQRLCMENALCSYDSIHLHAQTIKPTLLRLLHSNDPAFEFQSVTQGHKEDFRWDYFMGILQPEIVPGKQSDIQSGS